MWNSGKSCCWLKGRGKKLKDRMFDERIRQKTRVSEIEKMVGKGKLHWAGRSFSKNK